MERRNRSSYAKTRPVLRIGSELKDNENNVHKTGHNSKDLMETMGKTHELDSNTT